MFKFFKKEELPRTPAEELLGKIENILFPPLQTEIDKENKTYLLDTSIDSNLYAVYLDLEEGVCDDSVKNTVKQVHDRIYQIRELLNKFNELSENAEYVVVQDVETGKISKLG